MILTNEKQGLSAVLGGVRAATASRKAPWTLHRSRADHEYTRRERVEELQAQAERGTVKFVGNGMKEHRLHLARAHVLPALKTEVLPRRMSRTQQTGGLHGESFIHEMLAQLNVAAGLPIRVIAPLLGDELPHRAAARGRGVAHGVRDLVREPHRQQLWLEAEAAGRGIRRAREVLKAGEGDSPSANHQFAGIRAAHSDHEQYIDS